MVRFSYALLSGKAHDIFGDRPQIGVKVAGKRDEAWLFIRSNKSTSKSQPLSDCTQPTVFAGIKSD